MIDFYKMVHLQRPEVYDLKKHQRVILKTPEKNGLIYCRSNVTRKCLKLRFSHPKILEDYRNYGIISSDQ
jgi:hypothetical protein